MREELVKSVNGNVKLVIISDKLMVSDFMSGSIFTLSPDDNLLVLDQMMTWRAIRHIPIIDDEQKILGLVTHRDLLKAMVSNFSEASNKQRIKKLQEILIRDIMQENISTVRPDTLLKTAARIISDNKFGCLPVVDADDRVIGIITEADFVKIFAMA